MSGEILPLLKSGAFPLLSQSPVPKERSGIPPPPTRVRMVGDSEARPVEGIFKNERI
ncbi:hypothetical protein NIES4073_11970 [Kalymmatonema gypsitolerans NIES-4073]|nr:hypothetical protein NIES4073_11970 [Scytonema sp. NIES-4073]